MVKDSGERRKFDSGAVRDIQEGKGRCDLLPLTTIGNWLQDPVFIDLDFFRMTSDCIYLKKILEYFIADVSNFSGIPGAILEVAKHFEDGATKYGERNWEKGIPIHCYIDSAIRHYLKYLRRDNDERHDRAFCWNILCCMWTMRFDNELDDFTLHNGITEESNE